MDVKKTALAIVTFALVVCIGIIILRTPTNTVSPGVQQVDAVVVKDGIQYVTILARGGYAPKISSAEANIPTKLIMQTNGTYDCSLSLVIQAIGYQKILPSTGEEVIDLGTLTSGQSIRGVCSMGMYSFVINFT